MSDFEAQAALLIRAIRSLIETAGRPITTGTGSGRSLCFFIPIIDAAIRARAGREPARTPRYRDLSDESAGEQLDQLRPTFAR